MRRLAGTPADPAIVIVDHAAVGDGHFVAGTGVADNQVAIVVPSTARAGDAHGIVVGSGIEAETSHVVGAGVNPQSGGQAGD